LGIKKGGREEKRKKEGRKEGKRKKRKEKVIKKEEREREKTDLKYYMRIQISRTGEQQQGEDVLYALRSIIGPS
jgi:hypothetical protein